MNKEALQKYAYLIVKTGINIQKNQILIVSTPIECAYFARTIAQIAYEEGAREVVMNWRDELSTKIRYVNAPDEIFDEYPDWQKEYYTSYANKGAAFLSISASDPELMKDVDPGRMSRANKVSRSALIEYSERLMSNKNTWCVVSIPTASWAKKVFPDLTEDKAIIRLWEAIFKSVRVDTDNPVTAWSEHKTVLKKNMDYLNKNQLQYLQLRNSIGTDLKVMLPKNHIWLGGSEYSADGVEFIANMPTEEIFTVPARKGVDGIVVSSMPLNYNGNLIEDFSITFKDGQIIDFQAKNGYETLKQLVKTDEGSRYLGEIALVPYDSPISNMNILFYNTLFDENASCHLAIGKAYPVCLKDSEAMSKDELKAAGVNDSLVHVDFMFGTADMKIEGMTASGEMIIIFENGNFAF